MNLRYALRAVAIGCALAIVPLLAVAQTPASIAPAVSTNPWPREVRLTNAAALIYQPQLDKWADNRIAFHCAVAIKPADTGSEKFGAIFATARTKVDKTTRTVVLDDLQITKSDFPTLADRGAAYSAELQKQFASGVRTVALDRLKQSPALTASQPPAVPVQNNAPKVIVSDSPAILVPIDGAPAVRPVPGSTGFQRVINTRALILQRVVEKDFFIHVYDGWLSSTSIAGPWSQPFLPPTGIDAATQSASATHAVDLLDGGPQANPKPSLANGVPAIYTSQVPSELIVFRGQPAFVPIDGTGLLWASNSFNDVLVDTASKNYYALLAGRWFRASALAGPWAFVASNALPPDFAKIPSASPAGAVLQAVAGTSQAQVARNENSIAQTASVPRKNGPKFSPTFDGAPQYAPIPGTALSYAVNASAPVIQVTPGSYVAVKAGVWFAAPEATGPWTIATSVPESIYAIPPSSPVYYVTYVRIYDATPDVVHEGYTPGYLGTTVSPSGTVVYGTGYDYKSWIGNVWYPAPSTFGVGATPVYNQNVGYAYAFAVGLATPGWAEKYSGASFFHAGYWGGYPCCATTAANIYRRYGNYTNSPAPGANASAGGGMNASPQGNVASADSAAAPAPSWSSGSTGNNHYADANGNVYRQSGNGWQQQSATGWSNASGDTSWADQEAQARGGADVAAASYGMSNADRFTGAANTGWSARDAGDGGYSRTLGGSGGISAEYDNYWNTVQDNEAAMWADGIYGGGNLFYSGIGWSSRFPAP